MRCPHSTVYLIQPSRAPNRHNFSRRICNFLKCVMDIFQMLNHFSHWHVILAIYILAFNLFDLFLKRASARVIFQVSTSSDILASNHVEFALAFKIFYGLNKNNWRIRYNAIHKRGPSYLFCSSIPDWNTRHCSATCWTQDGPPQLVVAVHANEMTLIALINATWWQGQANWTLEYLCHLCNSTILWIWRSRGSCTGSACFRHSFKIGRKKS